MNVPGDPRQAVLRNDPNGRALTGLRGVAAVVVVLHHLLLHLGAVDAVPGVGQRGYLAVDLFFVLSGFVMALGYGTWFAGAQTWQEYMIFLSRRVARLWPLHTAVLTMLLLDGAMRHTGEYWPRMAMTNLLLIQSWGFSQTVITPAWSVSTEILAYILFPLLGGIALRRTPRVAWFGLAGAIGLLVAAVALAPAHDPGQRGTLDLHENWSLLPMMRCLGEFGVGLLTWRVLRDARMRTWAGRSATASLAGLLIIAMLVGGAPDLVVTALFPVLIAGLYAGRGAVVRGLGSRSCVALGVGSYALYLVHYPVLGVASGLVDRAWVVPTFLALVIPATLAGYWLVERPAQAVLRRWSAYVLTSVPGLAAR